MPAVAALPAIIGAGASIGGSLLNRRAGASDTTNRSAQSQTQFDPYTLELMKSLHGQGAGVLGDYMKNPWNAGFFNQQQARSNEAIGQRANVLQQNLLNPAFMSASGASNPSAFMASQMAAIGRGASREKAESLTDLLLGAENLRRGAAGGALGYQPLQTGSNTTETTQATQKKGSLWGDILGAAGAGLSAWGNSRNNMSTTPNGNIIRDGFFSGSGNVGTVNGRYPGFFG